MKQTISPQNYLSMRLWQHTQKSLTMDLTPEESKILFSLYLDWLNSLLRGLRSGLVRSLIEISLPRGAKIKTLEDLRKSLPADIFALILGTAAHCSEIDDSEFVGETHPSAAIFSALMALHDSKTNPDAIFKSAKIGFEIIHHVGCELNPHHYRAGWHGTSTVGSFGAFAAANTYLNGSRESFTNGLCIVSNELSGIHGSFGTEIKPLNAGNAARNGVFAALLSSKDIKGRIDIFECFGGVFQMFGKTEEETIPSQSPLNTVHTKKFPSCHSTHCFIENALLFSIMDPEEIKSIDIFGSDYAISMCDILKPQTRAEAFFSIAYVVATALLLKKVELEDFSASSLSCPQKQSLLTRINLHSSSDLSEFASRIKIQTRTGKILEHEYCLSRDDTTVPHDFIAQRFNSTFLEILKTDAPILGREPGSHFEIWSAIKDNISVLGWA